MSGRAAPPPHHHQPTTSWCSGTKGGGPLVDTYTLCATLSLSRASSRYRNNSSECTHQIYLTILCTNDSSDPNHNVEHGTWQYQYRGSELYQAHNESVKNTRPF
ncbi:hypothetical protein CBL_06642 [Carabus blaptoides fortunei]